MSIVKQILITKTQKLQNIKFLLRVLLNVYDSNI